MTLVCIAGGSGSGKSTLAIALHRRYPKSTCMVSLDDYFKKPEDAVQLESGSINWDHPGSLRFDDLLMDIRALRLGQSIQVMTKSELYHPEYDPKLKNKIPYTIEPRPVILFEGYLALHDPRVREVMGFGIYLDMPIEESLRRRSGNKFVPPEEYWESVLIPTHERFVQPTAAHTDLLVEVAGRAPEEVFRIVQERLWEQGILPREPH